LTFPPFFSFFLLDHSKHVNTPKKEKKDKNFVCYECPVEPKIKSKKKKTRVHKKILVIAVPFE